MAWAHLLSLSSAMSNPWEYRELMKAQFQVNSDKTVDQVVAEQKARHAANTPRGRASKGVREPVAPSSHGVAAPSEIAKMQAMLAAGKQNQTETPE